MGEPIRFNREDYLVIGGYLLVAAAMVGSGGVVPGVVSGQVVGFVLGMVAFAGAVVFGDQRLLVRGWHLPWLGWAASAEVVVLLRFFPAGILVLVLGLVVGNRLCQRRIHARVEAEQALEVLTGEG